MSFNIPIYKGFSTFFSDLVIICFSEMPPSTNHFSTVISSNLPAVLNNIYAPFVIIFAVICETVIYVSPKLILIPIFRILSNHCNIKVRLYTLFPSSSSYFSNANAKYAYSFSIYVAKTP